MTYKIANIKWLRDQGWNISSSYTSDLCPTYNEIVNEIPKGSITVDVSGTYSNNQLVCEKDINIITEKFITLTLNNGSVVDIQGSGELTESIMSSYKGSVVNAVVGTLCTSISDTAFRECPNLESVSISKTVTSIGNATFAYCNKLTTITVDSGNSIYDSRNNCNGIVKKSSNTLIAGCKTTIIPNTVTTVGNSAFWEIESLTSINIPNSVTVLGDDAFSRCYALTSVTLSSNLTTIGGSFFRYCPFTSITIPNSVTTIEQQAFQGGGLVDIVVPDNVTTINVATYEECNNATAVTIHSDVDNIYIRAFSGCSDLTKITVEATYPPTLLTHSAYPSDGIDTVFGNTNNCPIYVPCESVNAYKTAWPAYESRITCDSADCEKYGWTGDTLQQGVRDNVGGPVGYSVVSAGLLVLRSKPNWVTFITATTSDRIAYICKAEDNTGKPRSGDVVFRSPDGKCEFSGTVEQAAQTIQVYLTFYGLPSNLKSGGLTVVGSTYSVNFPLAGQNAGKGILSGSINSSDTRKDMTFSGSFTTVSDGGTILNSCDGHQGYYYTVSTASWNLATKTLIVNFGTCS